MAAACVSMENLGQGLFGVQLEVDKTLAPASVSVIAVLLFF